MMVKITYPIIAYNSEEIEMSEEEYQHIVINGNSSKKATFVNFKLADNVASYDEPIGYPLLIDSFEVGDSKFEIVDAEL